MFIWAFENFKRTSIKVKRNYKIQKKTFRLPRYTTTGMNPNWNTRRPILPTFRILSIVSWDTIVNSRVLPSVNSTKQQKLYLTNQRCTTPSATESWWRWLSSRSRSLPLAQHSHDPQTSCDMVTLQEKCSEWVARQLWRSKLLSAICSAWGSRKNATTPWCHHVTCGAAVRLKVSDTCFLTFHKLTVLLYFRYAQLCSCLVLIL